MGNQSNFWEPGCRSTQAASAEAIRLSMPIRSGVIHGSTNDINYLTKLEVSWHIPVHLFVAATVASAN